MALASELMKATPGASTLPFHAVDTIGTVVAPAPGHTSEYHQEQEDTDHRLHDMLFLSAIAEQGEPCRSLWSPRSLQFEVAASNKEPEKLQVAHDDGAVAATLLVPLPQPQQ